MLRKETFSFSTLELLKTLMADDLLKGFFLVGGTALSLQIGHRVSIDIDLFSTAPFSEDEILTELEGRYGYRLDYRSKNTLKGEINGVKVDLVSHRYPLVKPLLEIENVRMATLEDIAAMKLNAISVNGSRLKDFIDVAYLSSNLNLSQMVDAYEEKYNTRNPTMIVKALDYHKDINFNEPIEMVGGQYLWVEIEHRLRQMTLNPTKTFQEMKVEKKRGKRLG